MPTTARKHFGEDMKRARAVLLLGQREAPSDADLASDLARSSVVFAVGALDAYLCDAFVDVLARTMHDVQDEQAAAPDRLFEALPSSRAALLHRVHVTAQLGAADGRSEADGEGQSPPALASGGDVQPSSCVWPETRLSGRFSGSMEGPSCLAGG